MNFNLHISYLVAIILVIIVAMPFELSKVALSINSPLGRLNIIDLFLFMNLLLPIFILRPYIISRIAKKRLMWLFSGLIVYGFVIGLLRMESFRDFGLDIRDYIGILAGISFGFLLLNIEDYQRTFILCWMAIVTATTAFLFEINVATNIFSIYGSAGRYIRALESNWIFYISTFSIFLSPKIFDMYLYKKKYVYFLALVLIFYISIAILTGTRSLLILIFAIWVLILGKYLILTRGYGVKKLFILLVTSLLLFIYLYNHFSFFSTYYTSTYKRIDDFLNRDTYGDYGRIQEAKYLLSHLDAIDIVFGRGLGGRTYDVKDNQYIRFTHISVLMWLWKFGIFGLIVCYISIKTVIIVYFFRSGEQKKNITPNNFFYVSSSSPILGWVVLTFISGGWHNIMLYALGIHGIQVYYSYLKNVSNNSPSKGNFLKRKL